MLEKQLNPHILNVFLFLNDLKNVEKHNIYIYMYIIQGLMKNKKRLKKNMFFSVFKHILFLYVHFDFSKHLYKNAWFWL